MYLFPSEHTPYWSQHTTTLLGHLLMFAVCTSSRLRCLTTSFTLYRPYFKSTAFTLHVSWSRLVLSELQNDFKRSSHNKLFFEKKDLPFKTGRQPIRIEHDNWRSRLWSQPTLANDKYCQRKIWSCVVSRHGSHHVFICPQVSKSQRTPQNDQKLPNCHACGITNQRCY